MMKKYTSHRNCLAALAGLALCLPILVRAGGNTGRMITRFEPAKSIEQIEEHQEGDTVVKVCRACRGVTLMRMAKRGQGSL